MSGEFTISVDKAGFPLIRPSGLSFEIAWLPITKIQFEHFMCDTGRYDDQWYQDILGNYNHRVTASALGLGNYWGAFLTGLLPQEALEFARWCGRGFDLPTATEWKEAIQRCAGVAKDEFVSAATDVDGVSERARQLIVALNRVTAQDTQQLGSSGRLMCDQMLMRLGIMEYVYEDHLRRSYGGWGKPNRRFSANMFDPLRDENYVRLGKSKGEIRMKQYGARLIRRV